MFLVWYYRYTNMDELYEQRDLLKLLILLEDDENKRERWVKRLSTVKGQIEQMGWLDNPQKYV